MSAWAETSPGNWARVAPDYILRDNYETADKDGRLHLISTNSEWKWEVKLNDRLVHTANTLRDACEWVAGGER